MSRARQLIEQALGNRIGQLREGMRPMRTDSTPEEALAQAKGWVVVKSTQPINSFQVQAAELRKTFKSWAPFFVGYEPGSAMYHMVIVLSEFPSYLQRRGQAEKLKTLRPQHELLDGTNEDELLNNHPNVADFVVMPQGPIASIEYIWRATGRGLSLAPFEATAALPLPPVPFSDAALRDAMDRGTYLDISGPKSVEEALEWIRSHHRGADIYFYRGLNQR